MNTQEAKTLGFNRGRTIASYIDVREIGTDNPEGYEILSEDDQKEWFMKDSFDSETSSREYSPFEFTAKELNGSECPDELWEAFEEGIFEGVQFEYQMKFDNEPY